MSKPQAIVLAYSGGLDTTVILHWLKENYRCDVYAYIADIGQEEDLEEIRERALNTGAKDAFVDDRKEEFVRDFIFPMLRANAVYEGYYLMGTSIARPLIAKGQIEYAKKVGADAVAHGATGKGNDQVRFELTYYALAPEIKVIAPWRLWNYSGRRDLIEYARKHGLKITVSEDKPYSIDRNVFHTSYEGGILEDPSKEAPPEILSLVSPERAPDKPEYVEIEFERGNPVAVNGERLSPYSLLRRLNELGMKHGIGIVDLVEDRYVGIKSRGVYVTPGGTILYHAHRAMESITLDREVMRLRDSFIPYYSFLIYSGFWFSPEREVLQAAIDKSQEYVTGKVVLKLYKGGVYVAGRESPYSLYSQSLVSFDERGGFDMKDSDGFIKINSIRLRLYGMRKRKEGD